MLSTIIFSRFPPRAAAVRHFSKVNFSVRTVEPAATRRRYTPLATL
ncbi:MAG: hypothetical protein V3V49_12305 [Candidatus Krumholzibacteria bacterium]